MWSQQQVASGRAVSHLCPLLCSKPCWLYTIRPRSTATNSLHRTSPLHLFYTGGGWSRPVFWPHGYFVLDELREDLCYKLLLLLLLLVPSSSLSLLLSRMYVYTVIVVVTLIILFCVELLCFFMFILLFIQLIRLLPGYYIQVVEDFFFVVFSCSTFVECKTMEVVRIVPRTAPNQLNNRNTVSSNPSGDMKEMNFMRSILCGQRVNWNCAKRNCSVSKYNKLGIAL